MAAHIVKLLIASVVNSKLHGTYSILGIGLPTNPSGVTSVDANPPGISFESMIIQDGPSCRASQRCGRRI